MVNTTILYIKLNQNVLVQDEDVLLKDIASVYCENKEYEAKANSLVIWHLPGGKSKRVVISIVKIVELLTRQLPNVEINNLGETDVIVERLVGKRAGMPVIICKIIVVSCICFFGTAFSIMTFHNDVGVPKVFAQLYEMITGETSGNQTVLEWSYTLGLGLGIILFYNHIGGRRLSKDPTPLEVEMRNYERDVNQTLVETAEREGKEISAEADFNELT